MKRFLAILLSAALILTSFSTTIHAATDDYDFITVEKDFGEVYFSCDYAEVGKEISVSVSGRENENLLYKWYIDGIQLENHDNTYTPTEDDYECMLEVEVLNLDGTVAGRRSMLISLFPVIYIETENREPIVSKEKYLDAHISIQGNAEFNSDKHLYDGDTQIRGRGNSTWQADKKPYRLKLDQKADLFGMGKNKHWVLISNPFDTSLLRNAVSYNLSADMGLNFQKSVWVDVVLNGKVVGNYQLCEHIRVDDTRVDITNWEDLAEDAAKEIYKAHTDSLTKDDRDTLVDIMAEDMSWTTSDKVVYKGVAYTVSDYIDYPSINGGYLTEIVRKSDEHTFSTSRGMYVCVDTPESLSDDMLDYIRGYYQGFEDALFSDDFCTEYNGKTVRYTDFIDLDSFVKGLLINEIFENPDFGRTSTWISQDIGGKLVYGPVWDMDFSLVATYSWTTAKVNWLKRLLCDPVFVKEMRETYFEYRYTAINDLIKDNGDIDLAIRKIESSAIHNDDIWNNDPTFFENATDLKYVLQRKISWLDKTLATPESTLKSIAGTAFDAKDIVFDEISSLEITVLPDKLTYNAGDTLDLTGLSLTATCRDGSKKSVTPDLVYTYVKDAFGDQLYSYGKVTEEIGNTYVVVRYRNASAMFPINVNPRTNYAEVEALIENLPAKTYGNRFVKEMFEAYIAYDALSESAKAKVSSYDKLVSLMAEFEKNAEATDCSVLACFADGLFKADARSPLVTISKDVPNKILYMSPSNGTSATYPTDHFAFMSQKTVGNFSITTINHLVSGSEDFQYQVKAIYRDLRKSEAFPITVSQLRDEAKVINSLEYNKRIDNGGKLTVRIDKDSIADKVRLLENGKDLKAVSETDANIITLTKPFTASGKHTITVEYLIGSSWIEYGSFDIIVHEKLTLDGTKILSNPYGNGTIEIPEYITEIADGAFDGFSGKIICYPGSAAEAFAKAHKISFETFRFSINASVLNMKPGETMKLSVTATPFMPKNFVLTAEADNKVLSFTNGTINALAPGYTRVKLSSSCGLFEEVISVYVSGGITKADIDGNGQINSLDALIILQACVDKIALNAEEKAAADVDGNGRINSLDALIVLQIVTEKRSIWDFIK
ncbi:MAG: CotH kinase family protein [Clostridia bacterium]|nr:CotH kinase family protein [Clostridia bacterium]